MDQPKLHSLFGPRRTGPQQTGPQQTGPQQTGPQLAAAPQLEAPQQMSILQRMSECPSDRQAGYDGQAGYGGQAGYSDNFENLMRELVSDQDGLDRFENDIFGMIDDWSATKARCSDCRYVQLLSFLNAANNDRNREGHRTFTKVMINTFPFTDEDDSILTRVREAAIKDFLGLPVDVSSENWVAGAKERLKQLFV